MRQHIRIHKAEPNKGILNYSHLLDAPAGKHGFVEARKGHLYFEDGTRARFLGFNVAQRSNVPDHETAEKLAERFASMGVNLIRLHAADGPIGKEPGSWSMPEEAPLLDYKKGSTRYFDAEGLDRFEYFAAKLKEKGIYLHIDLIVAREFQEADELDYPGGAPSCVKRYPMYNARMIELQKEYARQLLTHVNPYTGLALIDDPAVITVQINNEESAIKGTMDSDNDVRMIPYQQEVQNRFNAFLLMKYHNRTELAKAWTHDGICALGEEEDPEKNTVRGIAGGFYQPECDPMSDWDASEGPARYADFMEFGIYMNRRFYQDMKDYLISIGVKVPIVTSNLTTGAADVYGHADGDIMENNTYFNHPILPVVNDTYLVAGPVEYVSANPVKMQQYIGSMGTTLTSLGAVAAVKDKPYIISEWNEYGEHPFHSTAFVQYVAYACLNDWDGLILYNHHTSEKWDDQPADEIRNVFDAYNDPAVICQWGFMASVFLKGLVSVAKNMVDIVYTQNDLKSLPHLHSMPTTFLPYMTQMRNVFLDGGNTYKGDADAAVNAGFFNGCDLRDAGHGVYYSWSPYRDAFRRYPDSRRMKNAATGAEELEKDIYLGEQNLVFADIRTASDNGDYTKVAGYMDRAFKKWGMFEEGTGFVDGRLISDTKEIVFDPDHARFSVHTPYIGYFSGAPEESIVLSDAISVVSRNERISVSLIARGEQDLSGADEYILTAMGTTGMDETTMFPAQEMMGITLMGVQFHGKLYAETLEGCICVKAKCARLEILNPVGEVLETLEETADGNQVRFELDGSTAGLQYRLQILGR
ncbi:MAG: hypothetical protein Q4B22_08280 [Eubacteriales bacterium]|nr:hypothetical protein [Eubacteriales bacterium]